MPNDSSGSSRSTSGRGRLVRRLFCLCASRDDHRSIFEAFPRQTFGSLFGSWRFERNLTPAWIWRQSEAPTLDGVRLSGFKELKCPCCVFASFLTRKLFCLLETFNLYLSSFVEWPKCSGLQWIISKASVRLVNNEIGDSVRFCFLSSGPETKAWFSAKPKDQNPEMLNVNLKFVWKRSGVKVTVQMSRQTRFSPTETREFDSQLLRRDFENVPLRSIDYVSLVFLKLVFLRWRNLKKWSFRFHRQTSEKMLVFGAHRSSARVSIRR